MADKYLVDRMTVGQVMVNMIETNCSIYRELMEANADEEEKIIHLYQLLETNMNSLKLMLNIPDNLNNTYKC